MPPRPPALSFSQPTRRTLLAALPLLPGAAAAQGFAGMAGDATGFDVVRPGVVLRFPADHAPHPGFRIEWWYVTAALRGADGADYGVQWTLFRTALRPGPGGAGWDDPQLWFAHAAATSADAHRAAEVFARGGVGQAGVTLGPFDAWIDHWRLHGDDALTDMRMTASGADFAMDLALAAAGPLVLHGEGGFHRKAAGGQASHYYSQPFLRAAGRLTLDGREIAVTGHAWLDREWSSQPLDEDQTGWDWFSLMFDDGARCMLYRIRHRQGRDSFSGTWIDADGAAAQLAAGDAELEALADAEVAGRAVPVRWRVAIPGRGVAVDVAALNPQAWNALSIPYWEGPVSMTGTRPGRGYLEMTGY